MIDDEYELGPVEMIMDVWFPMLPVVGLIAICIGLIDMHHWDEGHRFHTQGKVRFYSALISHTIYLLAVLVLVAV